MNSIYDFKAVASNGKVLNFSQFKGKVMLIVNTASKCGFTPQFAGLEELNQKYKDKGLVIIGFPCNQFGQQDPGTDDEILDFCHVNYGVTFQMMKKIEVNGENASPIYTFLKEKTKNILGEDIKWNFTKFLVDRNGNVVARFEPTHKMEDVEEAVKKLL